MGRGSLPDRSDTWVPHRLRRLLRLRSSRTRLVGGEAWPSCGSALPAHPLPWQRLARPHAFAAPVSRGTTVLSRSPPQRLRVCKRVCISLFKLSKRLNQSPLGPLAAVTRPGGAGLRPPAAGAWAWRGMGPVARRRPGGRRKARRRQAPADGRQGGTRGATRTVEKAV